MRKIKEAFIVRGSDEQTDASPLSPGSLMGHRVYKVSMDQ